MLRSSALDVEADLAALRCAAERAGTALACLFSTSDELDAVIVARRRQGACRARRRLWSALGTLVLGLAFVLL